MQLPGGRRPGAGDTGMNGLALKVLPLSWYSDPCELPSQLLQPQLQCPTSLLLCLHHPRLYTGSRRCNLPVATSVPVLQAVAFPRMSFLAGQSLVYPPTPRHLLFCAETNPRFPEPSSAQRSPVLLPLLVPPSLLTTSRNSCVKWVSNLT